MWSLRGSLTKGDYQVCPAQGCKSKPQKRLDGHLKHTAPWPLSKGDRSCTGSNENRCIKCVDATGFNATITGVRRTRGRRTQSAVDWKTADSCCSVLPLWEELKMLQMFVQSSLPSIQAGSATSNKPCYIHVPCSFSLGLEHVTVRTD